MDINFSDSTIEGDHHYHDLEGIEINDSFFSQSSFATCAIAKKNNVISVPKDTPLKLSGPLTCDILVLYQLSPEELSNISFLYCSLL